MAIKDDIIEALADIRPLVATEIWPNIYRIIEAETIDDNAGGWTSTPVVIEAGPCWLHPDAGGRESEVAARLGYTTPYTVDLDITTRLTPAHTLEVDGRTFQVGSVSREQRYGPWAVAIVQEAR